MRNLLRFTFILIHTGLAFGQFPGCGNRINSVTLSPIAATNDISVSVNSDCCDVHSLDSHTYTNNAPNHALSLCYRDSGLLMQTNITSQIVLPGANSSGVQNLSINAFYYFGAPGGNCSANTVFNPPIILSFNGPLTEPRIFTLANNQFETRKLKLLPNPNNGVFSIDLPTNTDKAQVLVFDISGKEVYSNPTYSSGSQIELKNLSGGFYFAKVLFGEFTEAFKFVIK